MKAIYRRGRAGTGDFSVGLMLLTEPEMVDGRWTVEQDGARAQGDTVDECVLRWFLACMEPEGEA